ncbi:ATP--guanido phosphotransferase [candidate division TA06 bacterium]|uniref:ATP--guanido phosphotransferase n=1 Tax=candidate division TA06 bacterium TaxID=2250710 RepID=A0A933MJ13_UNCT6|nr:ATP--guanido phosphotransferase [candidate division TA06 bacterium]
MNPEDAGIIGLLQQPAGWTTAAAQDAESILSSRVRLARNLQRYNFPDRCREAERQEILEFSREQALKVNYFKGASFFSLDGISRLGKKALEERRIASSDLVDQPQAGVLISPEQNVSLMINEEDHLRLQTIFPGLDLLEAFRIADQVDDQLQDRMEVAFVPEHGFLTACPSNLGTGLRASVLMHLPVLALSDQMETTIEQLSQKGIMVRGAYGEGSRVKASLFQFSNRTSLGKSELEIVDEVEQAARTLLEDERKQGDEMWSKNRPELEDRVFRARAILSQARVLSLDEFLSLWSAVRMGIGLGLVNQPNLGGLNRMLFTMQPAHLQFACDRTMDPAQEDIERAARVREFFA